MAWSFRDFRFARWVALAAACASCGPSQAVVLGDVDGDSRVTVMDVGVAFRIMALGEGKPAAVTRSDVWPTPGTDGRLRGDGQVTSEDVRAILTTVLSRRPPVDAGRLVVTLAGNGVGKSVDGVGTQASLSDPYDIAVAPNGDLFIVDASGFRVRRLKPDGRLETVCGTGRRGFLDGSAQTACFNGPYGIAMAPDGSLYIADRFNHCVRKVSPDGEVTTVAGTGRPGFKDGPGSLAQFNSPQGLRVDAQGVVWVADTFNHRIRRIDLDGTVSTVAGDGRPGMEDGPAMEARFSSPSGVQPDPSDGSLWVADTDNHAIRRILPDGTVVTVSGNGRPGFVDGTWADARFFRPFGFALDRRGDLYVADWGNEAVRVLHPWGTVETIAGGQQEGYRDGPALTAHLHGLMNVAVDENGLIYLADTDNERIRVVLP